MIRLLFVFTVIISLSLASFMALNYHARYIACAKTVEVAVALHRTEDTAADMYITSKMAEDPKEREEAAANVNEVYTLAMKLRVQFAELAKDCK